MAFDLNERHKERRKTDKEFRERRNAAVRKWTAKPENKARHNKTTYAWQLQDRKDNPEKWALIFKKNRCKRYGKTLEWFDEESAKQNHVCALCLQPEMRKQRSGLPMNLSIDHCHTTGIVRGLLCSKCNWSLHLLEKKGWIDRAVAYLEKYKRL